MNYNLSICSVDGSIYGFICDDKIRLNAYLREYDHEGASIHLTRKDGDNFIEFYNDDVYKELAIK